MFRLTIFVLVAFMVLEVIADHRAHFEDFKKRHGKKYKDAEDERRHFETYSEKMEKINAHNEEFKAGKHTFMLKENKYTDLSRAEIAKYLKGYVPSAAEKLLRTRKPTPKSFYPNHNKSVDAVITHRKKRDIPYSFDWRDQGAVVAVKDQGQCGSCWAFATAGVLESHQIISGIQLISLSEQNLIDCVTECSGCEGGSIYRTLTHVLNDDSQTVCTEDSYPYQAMDGTCHGGYDGIYSRIESVEWAISGDESDLMRIVGTIGPVAVAMDASSTAFDNYGGGLYNPGYCSSTDLDHAVLLIGYGTDPDYGDYWTIKNSWGTSWGENGHMRIPRNQDNYCGLATSAFYPVMTRN